MASRYALTPRPAHTAGFSSPRPVKNRKTTSHIFRANALTFAISCALIGLVGVVGGPRPALAAESGVGAASQNYAVPAGRLSDVLAEFAATSGVQLVYDPQLLAGLSSGGLQGQYSVREGFARLLVGSGYEAVNAGNGRYALRQLPQAVSGDVATLAAVTVTGSRIDNDGFVATYNRTGTKTDTPLLETPRSISVITRDEMEARGSENIMNAVDYTPGVMGSFVGLDNRSAYGSIRGFVFPQIYRDGLRNVTRDETVEPYGLEEIAILKGPSSTLYGQGSPGGVINTQTKRPTDTPLREVVLGAGNHNKWRAAFDFSGPIDEDKKFLYRLTGLTRKSDSIQAPHLKDELTYIAPAFTWRLTPSTNFTLLMDYQKDRHGYDYLLTLPGRKLTRTYLGEPDFNRYETERYSIGYQLDQEFSEALTFRQNLRYISLDLQNRNLQQGALAPDLSSVERRIQDIDNNHDGLTLDNQAQFGFSTGEIDHTLLLGIDYRRATADLRTRSGMAPSLDLNNIAYGQPFPQAPLTGNSSQVEEQTGLYFQEQVAWGDWRLSAGGRYDNARSRTQNHLIDTTNRMKDSKFTKSLGLNYVFPQGFSPYISYSESFNPQSGTDFNNNAFQPTTGKQIETGLKFESLDGKTFATLAAYELKQNNMLTSDPDNPGFRVQTGQVRVRGIELEVKSQVTSALTLAAAYTYQKGEVTRSNVPGEEGNYLGNMPKHMASLWADYAIHEGHLKGVSLGAGVRYTGSSYNNNANTIKSDGYALWDAALRYDLSNISPAMKGTQLSVNATNLTNKEYKICLADTTCYYGGGRTIMANLRYRW